MAQSILHRLPEELLHDILVLLNRGSLCEFGLACHWTYAKSMPLVWRDLELGDCATKRHTGSLTVPSSKSFDDHDDTPTIHKLITIVK